MFEEKVQNGIKWLDANNPGWIDKINLEKLNIFSTLECVLGQVYGSFGDGLDHIKKTELNLQISLGEFCQQHGFAHSALSDDSSWEQLKNVWVSSITQKKGTQNV